jgi:hypothetical protein
MKLVVQLVAAFLLATGAAAQDLYTLNWFDAAPQETLTLFLANCAPAGDGGTTFHRQVPGIACPVAISDGRPYRDSWPETGFWEIGPCRLLVSKPNTDEMLTFVGTNPLDD